MNDFRCSEVDGLLTGYAADALDEDERCAVATHLAECRNHDAEFVASLEPQRVLVMPEGELDYWSDDMLDLVALS